MEATLMKTLAVLLLFSVCSRGNAQQCSLSDLTLTQTETEADIFAVTVENKCICAQLNIKLECPGFTSNMGVDLAILWPDSEGDLCTLNNGGAVDMGPENAVKFMYTASSQINFKPASSTIDCS